MSAPDVQPSDQPIWASRSYPLREDMPFQLRSWRVERIGWFAMGILVVLACVGLFSDGPLSSATVTDEAKHLHVDYDRFYRLGGTGTMQWRVAATTGSETSVVVNRSFVEAFTIETIAPEPSKMVSTPDGIALSFDHRENSPLNILLGLRPTTTGTVYSEIGLAGTAKTRFRSFIYP